MTNTAFAARAAAHFRKTGHDNLVAIAEKAIAAAPTREELIAEAGRLNGHPALVNTDHVSFMGFLDRDECERHVEKLRALAA